MYCMRRSALRKYTFAALNGTGAVMAPETLARLSSSAPSAAALAAARSNADIHLATRMRASLVIQRKIYSSAARFATGAANSGATREGRLLS